MVWRFGECPEESFNPGYTVSQAIIKISYAILETAHFPSRFLSYILNQQCQTYAYTHYSNQQDYQLNQSLIVQWERPLRANYLRTCHSITLFRQKGNRTVPQHCHATASVTVRH